MLSVGLADNRPPLLIRTPTLRHFAIRFPFRPPHRSFGSILGAVLSRGLLVRTSYWSTPVQRRSTTNHPPRSTFPPSLTSQSDSPSVHLISHLVPLWVRSFHVACLYGHPIGRRRSSVGRKPTTPPDPHSPPSPLCNPIPLPSPPSLIPPPLG